MKNKLAQRASRRKKRIQADREESDRQQERLYNHPLRYCLQDRWHKAANSKSKPKSSSHFAIMGRLGDHILGAQAASCTLPDRDYVLTDLDGLDGYLERDWVVHPEIIVLRDDRLFSKESRRVTSNDLIKSLPTESIINFQDFGLPSEQIYRELPTPKFQRRWASSNGQIVDKPMNLLNMSSSNYEITPPPLLNRCSLLHKATRAVKVDALARKTNAGLDLVGKPTTTDAKMDADLESCLQFQICSQAGAISGWHMDSTAPITWATLERNDDHEGAEDTIKYWAVVLVPDECLPSALEAFGEKGPEWEPPREWIRIISLIPGDYLIMPPGTIHAPISPTNCFFRGGMCWDSRIFLTHTLPMWKFIMAHRDKASNEDHPKQAANILNKVAGIIRLSPADFNLSSEKDIDDAIRDCQWLADASMPCECIGSCHDVGAEHCRCQAGNFVCLQYCPCSCSNK